MDEIIETTSPANGTTVTVVGTPPPYLTAGKLGNAINLGNSASNDGKYLDLGQHTSRCVDNLAICDNGWTLAFWYFIPVIEEYRSGTLIKGTNFRVLCWQDERGPIVEALIYPYSDGFRMSLLGFSLSFHQWHHIAVSYLNSDTLIGKLFLNGRLFTSTGTTFKENIQTNDTITIGCVYGTSCTAGPFDELYIWEVEQSADFIWDLYSQI